MPSPPVHSGHIRIAFSTYEVRAYARRRAPTWSLRLRPLLIVQNLGEILAFTPLTIASVVMLHPHHGDITFESRRDRDAEFCFGPCDNAFRLSLEAELNADRVTLESLITIRAQVHRSGSGFWTATATLHW